MKRIILYALLLSACAPLIPLSTQLREDGFNRQAAAFERLRGDKTYAETEIRVKVIVTENIPNGWAAAYSHPEGIIWIKGKVVKGKIVVPTAILGHEVGHALQYQDGHGRFVDPDEMRTIER
jgi:hypothetical protein